ncbi:hypothetical protein AAFF_G00105850 [Aldrovandia affinis]|uniref:Uncharacterized protein n=1 Tax=Aldrovandia affinis TaxID=143900 RepID=A0AAD7T281_9TELE|nr:hypothetical protein AAFF_G00105850 [Aldrovandia affinis]
MASNLSSAHNSCILDNSGVERATALGSLEWIDWRATGCQKSGKAPGPDGMLKCLISIAILLLLLQSALAFEDEGSYEGSALASLPQDPASSSVPSYTLASLSLEEQESSSDSPAAAESARKQPAFSSILTMLAGMVQMPQTLVHTQPSTATSSNDAQTDRWPSENQTRGAQPSPAVPAATGALSPSSEEMTTNKSSTVLGSPLSASEAEVPLTKNVTSSAPTRVRYASTPSKVEATPTQATSTTTTLATQEPVQNATPQPTSVTSKTVPTTTEAATTTTVAPAPPTTTTAQTTTTQTEATTTERTTMTTIMTTTTTTARRTTTTLTPTFKFTTQTLKTLPPRGIVPGPHPTPTPEVPQLQCNLSERLWVKTVLSIHMRRNRLEATLRQNLPKGLTQALQRALNDTTVHAQIETLAIGSNVSVGFYAVSGSMVYTASVVVEALSAYGAGKLVADIRQFVPALQGLPSPISPWVPSPAISPQLNTVLRFVGAEDDIKSCSFSQMMEQRLENAFAEAASKVLSTHSRLSVQILSASQLPGSASVSLLYVVWNGSTTLNGTASSNLLNQLTAELVGYFLFFPPLVIAEPLEYHNLNTSAETRDYWVITVIQDVESSSLEGNYQSFASLMEQRLAEAFVVARQEGARFRRAATAGSYTVQMVSIRRVAGPKNPAEMTYYVQLNGVPVSGTSAAKILNTVDSQTMALTLGYFIQLQAEPVVKNPPNNLWIIAAVLAPIAVVTVIIIIITAVLCRKNKGDFKTDAMGNLNPRTKTSYRREASYYHQPVQGFDYAKQHLGQQGGDEEALPVTQETMVLPLPKRDAPLPQERGMHLDGSGSKKTMSSDIRKSRLPSEDGSLISSESGKLHSVRGSSAQKLPAQQKMTKEETRARSDHYDSSSGSLQLISIKPMAAPPTYSGPASSDRSQDSAILNGEVSMALKQKSDIEHYRNKLRLKAKRKGYDFPAIDTSNRSYTHRQRHSHDKTHMELSKALETDEERASTYIKSRRRHPQMRNPVYRSRQSLNSPSPGGTEMDLLVMRERPRRGIRNSGYDTEPELIEETNVDRLMGSKGYAGGRQVKGHSETSTLSSQPSIDEVRQQMHLLLEEAFSLASAGRSHGHAHYHHLHSPYSPGQPIPYSDMWVPAYGPDAYQCSLPKPAFRFTQLPDMAVGSSPPPIPPRTGPPPGTSLGRSSTDMGPKARTSESSLPETHSQRDCAPYVPITRAPLPPATTDQSMSSYSGNPITAVYAIPGNRAGYSGYFVPTPPSSYRSPSWMSYPPEPEELPQQWADSVPLPGYVEAFPHPQYPQSSPLGLPRQYSQASSTWSGLDQPPTPSTAASEQSLTETVDTHDTSLSNISTSALVKAIREEVAKLAKKQTNIFDFQV